MWKNPKMLVYEITGGMIKKWDARFPSTNFTWKYAAVQHKIAISNWMFSKNTTILTKDKAIMIYMVDKGLPVNLGQFVFNAIMKAFADEMDPSDMLI